MQWPPTKPARNAWKIGWGRPSIATRRNLWSPSPSPRPASMYRRFCGMRVCTDSCTGRRRAIAVGRLSPPPLLPVYFSEAKYNSRREAEVVLCVVEETSHEVVRLRAPREPAGQVVVEAAAEDHSEAGLRSADADWRSRHWKRDRNALGDMRRAEQSVSEGRDLFRPVGELGTEQELVGPGVQEKGRQTVRGTRDAGGNRELELGRAVVAAEISHYAEPPAHVARNRGIPAV